MFNPSGLNLTIIWGTPCFNTLILNSNGYVLIIWGYRLYLKKSGKCIHGLVPGKNQPIYVIVIKCCAIRGLSLLFFLSGYRFPHILPAMTCQQKIRISDAKLLAAMVSIKKPLSTYSKNSV